MGLSLLNLKAFLNPTNGTRQLLRRLRRHSHTAAPPPNIPESASAVVEFTRHCYQSDLPRSMRALEAMKRQGLRADAVTYSELIKCCVGRRAVQEGRLVAHHIFSNGHAPDTFLINNLLSMYLKFGLLEDAHKVFDEMPERNVVSWTTMISGFANAKLDGKALEFLVLMVRDGVRPNVFTFSSVLRACRGLSNLEQLHCCVVKVGSESSVFVQSALIDAYSKWGELGSAMRVFDEMRTRDLVVWNSIIGGFAQNSDCGEALNLFKKMKRAGVFPDKSTLTSVLRACTCSSLLELGRQVHVHILKFNRDLILNNAILDMYCKCGSLEDANFVFTRMVEKDVISWSTMISGLAQNSYSQEALKLFDSMRASGCRPNHITMLGVLFACSHAGLVEEGLHHFRSMEKRFGIKPEREHYGCIIDLLGRAGRFDEAVELVNEMECDPDAATWRMLLAACRVHNNVNLAIHSAKQILKLEPQDAGTYILLSNIYANSQRWEDAAEVRRTMAEKGVKKEPGCSWIEVDKQIHAFSLGDSSHPQITEINRELNSLVHRLTEAGYTPDTNFVLQDLEGEQKENSLRYHSEKLAIVFGIMRLSREKTIRIRKNIRICGDCHLFAKLVAKVEDRRIVIRDPIRYHHFCDGVCSCGDYW